MRWILVGARGIVRTVLSSPRLQGYIADPLELLPVSGDVVAEIVSKRIEEFRFDDETYVPVEPMDFGDLVALFRGDLRAAFKLCQEYSLELAGGSWPEGDHKREALNDYVDRVAQRHYIALDGISERGRRLFADICSIGGLCSAADHLAVGFNDAEGLGKEIEPLLRYQLLTEAAVAPDHPDLWLVTSKGWLVFREF